MTTVNSTNLASYYSLKDATTSTTSQHTTVPSLADAFAAVNNTNSDPTNTNNGNSYLLDLSDSAKAYLQNYSGSSSNSSTSSSNGAKVILNHDQQQKLNAILQKYKDAPYTDATFKQIQVDMSKAGIGADTLAAQSQMRSLNPTMMLLDALSGGDASVGTIGSSADINTQATALMKSVAQQWTSISTTAASTTKSSTSSDATTSGSSAA